MTRISTKTEPNVLFSYALMSPHVQDHLPEGYSIRPLHKEDFDKGFLDVLAQLSDVGSVSKKQFEARFGSMKRRKAHYIIVIEHNTRIVACATLVLEQKFLHSCGSVGHIEDVVVHDSQRGKRLGNSLIDQLHHMATSLRCYKTILNCAPHNVPFYEKCQLRQTHLQMTRYFDKQQ